MFSSIRVRLSLSHLAVILLAMGISAFLLLSFLEDYFMDSTRKSLEAQARITAQALFPTIASVEYSYSDSLNSESPSVVQVQMVSQNTISGTPTAGQEVYSNVINQQVSDWDAAYNTTQYYSKDTAFSVQSQNIDLGSNEGSVSTTDTAYMADTSLQLGAELNTRIRILDADGVVLVDSLLQEQGTDLHSDSLVGSALEGEIASRTEMTGEDTMHLAFPVSFNEATVGIIYLSQPLNDVTAVLNDLENRMLLAAGIALAISALVALLLSRAISNPLRRLTAAAAAVARGQLNQQVPVGSKGEIGQLSETFNDMTKRLQAARQMQTDFVANVSHESRTPLTSIKGMIETLRDGAVEDHQTRDRFLTTIESETDRLIRLVNDLLLLSRADSEALNLQLEPLDLNTLIKATINQLEVQTVEKDLGLKAEIPPNIPLVLADSDRIKQILVNLLDNAIKYSRQGGFIVVTAAANPDGKVITKVQDNGIGIPPTDLPRIGERFYRTDKSRSRAEGGTGLGLAIVHVLVEAHGGELSLESQEGKGTTVTFTLPVV